MSESDVKMVAQVPKDDYYREQIRVLHRKVDDLQIKTEAQSAYIETLERNNLELLDRVDHLRGKLADMIEGCNV